MSMHKGLLGQSEGGASVRPFGGEAAPLTGTPGFDRHPYMKHSTADPGTEKTLAQYIARKVRNDAFNTVNAEKKLSFEDWFLAYIGMPFEDWDNNLGEDDMRAAWKAAQENV